MRRKVVQQGTSTLMVSLPAAWTRRNGITKGTEVELREEKDRVIILPTTEAIASRIEIDITGMEEPLLRMLEGIEGTKGRKTYGDPETFKTVQAAMLRLFTALYKAGYDEIRMTYARPGTIDFVQGALAQEISEYEIVEQGKNHCVLQDISGVLKERFDPAVRRSFYLLQQMAEESVPILESGEHAQLKPLRFLEESINRFTTFTRRLLSKKGYVEPDRIAFIYLIIDRIELVGDQYKYLFDHLLERPQAKLGKPTRELYARLARFVREYHELFATREKARIVKLQALREGIVRDCLAQFDKGNNDDKMVLHYVITITQMLFEAVEPAIALGPLK